MIRLAGSYVRNLDSKSKPAWVKFVNLLLKLLYLDNVLTIDFGVYMKKGLTVDRWEIYSLHVEVLNNLAKSLH